MRFLTAIFLVSATAACPAAADVSLTLWLKSAEHPQDETICVVSRGDDGSMSVRVQKPTNSYPAPALPILDASEASDTLDAALIRITDGTMPMNEMNPDIPWYGVDGMEMQLIVDGSRSLWREAGLDVPAEVLALFDPLGEGDCTRLANR